MKSDCQKELIIRGLLRQPLKSLQVDATPRREVASVVVNPKDPLGLEGDDDLDLLKPVDIQMG